jgi:hypothetical protein
MTPGQRTITTRDGPITTGSTITTRDAEEMLG